jgi:hypothetical protein
MEIALGISMTSTTVRMVLVEGDKADGLTVESDQFSTIARSGTLAPSAPEQVGVAILATQQSASRQGHNVNMCGIAVSDECDADDLRESLAARGLTDTVIVDEHQAAVTLAHTVARAIGYTQTALLLVRERSATLSVVDVADRSIIEGLSRSLQSADINYVLAEMLASFSAEGARGLFVVDSSTRLPVISRVSTPIARCQSSSPRNPTGRWPAARPWRRRPHRASKRPPQGWPTHRTQTKRISPIRSRIATGALAPADEATKRGLVDVIRWGSTGNPGTRDGGRFSAPRSIPVSSLAASLVIVGVVAAVVALAASTAPRQLNVCSNRTKYYPPNRTQSWRLRYRPPKRPLRQ